jgi:hypothetical protein
MGLPPNHHTDLGGRLKDDIVFNKSTFAAYANAVTLSKLLLLNGPVMDQMLSDRIDFPYRLYAQDTIPVVKGNVMTTVLPGVFNTPPPPRDATHWLPSIDDDHTWRIDGQPVREEPTGNGNFPLWEDCRLRTPVFRVLFRDWQNDDLKLPDGRPFTNFPALGDKPTGMFGPSPPVEGSTGFLSLPDDVRQVRVFRWRSDDTILGDVDTGDVIPQTWVTAGTDPTRLAFNYFTDNATPSRADDLRIQGNVLLEPYFRGVVDIVKGLMRVRYLVTCEDDPSVAAKASASSVALPPEEQVNDSSVHAGARRSGPLAALVTQLAGFATRDRLTELRLVRATGHIAKESPKSRGFPIHTVPGPLELPKVRVQQPNGFGDLSLSLDEISLDEEMERSISLLAYPPVFTEFSLSRLSRV